MPKKDNELPQENNLSGNKILAIIDPTTGKRTKASIQTVFNKMGASQSTGSLGNYEQGVTEIPSDITAGKFYFVAAGTYPEFGGLVVPADQLWQVSYNADGTWTGIQVPKIGEDGINAAIDAQKDTAGGVASYDSVKNIKESLSLDNLDAAPYTSPNTQKVTDINAAYRVGYSFPIGVLDSVYTVDFQLKCTAQNKTEIYVQSGYITFIALSVWTLNTTDNLYYSQVFSCPLSDNMDGQVVETFAQVYDPGNLVLNSEISLVSGIVNRSKKIITRQEIEAGINTANAASTASTDNAAKINALALTVSNIPAQTDIKINSALTSFDIDASKVANGTKKQYVSSVQMGIGSGLVTERNSNDDFIIYDNPNPGNGWIVSPVFNPAGSNLVIISFKIEFLTRPAGMGFQVIVADGVNATDRYSTIQTITDDNTYFIQFDPAYFTVYKQYAQFYIWLNNMPGLTTGQELKAKISKLSVYEITDKLSTVNIQGSTVKELLKSTDDQISALKENSGGTSTDTSIVVSPSGKKFKLLVADDGTVNSVPIVPNIAKFFGNSLLRGAAIVAINGSEFGMAATDPTTDFYALFNRYLVSINQNYQVSKNSLVMWEQLEDVNNIASTIDDIVANLSGNEDLIIIEGGDNVNNAARMALLPQSSIEFVKRVRAKSKRARVIWTGIWFGDAEKYAAIQNACDLYGVQFISLADLPSAETNQHVGGITNHGRVPVGWQARTLSNVTNIELVSDNGSTKTIKATFSVASDTYTSDPVEVYSYSLDNGVMTYDSEYAIIDIPGVAAHPGDLGFKKIANRLLYKSLITDNEETYQ